MINKLKSTGGGKKTKKGMRIFGAIILCALMINTVIPLCLAHPGRVEFEDEIGSGEITLYRWVELGELHKGDIVKVVITDIRGESALWVGLTTSNSIFGHQYSTVTFSFPGEKELTVLKEGTTYLYFFPAATENKHVLYKGYAEW